MLVDNLERQGVDLRVEDNLLYLDVNNLRIGINQRPDYPLHVNGDARIGNVEISGTSISGIDGPLDLGTPNDITIGGGNNNYVLTTDGAGNIRWSDVGSLAQATGATGMSIILGTPTDSSLNENASWDSWTDQVKVTDAIDDLNQVALNIAKGTYVGAVRVTSDITEGPSPSTVQFTAEYVGNPDSFEWNFGDGSDPVTTSTPTVTHTYDDADGAVYTVSVLAYNTTGTLAGDLDAGARGSVDQEVRQDYFTLYTPSPIPAFQLATDVLDSGDDTGLLVSNQSQYADGYEINWGDGQLQTLDPEWVGEYHNYTNDGGDARYSIVLSASSSTAGPAPGVTVDSDAQYIYVYSTHTPTFTANVTRVVNEELTSGGTVSFDNTTATDPGVTAIFADNRYQWQWDDGSSDTVSIDSTVLGNPGQTLTHTFALSTADQSAGVSRSYDVKLAVINGHSQSPFESAATTIVVEPDVRADFSGTAVTVSDRDGDDEFTGYVFTDYNGLDRGLFSFDNQSQNASSYNWSWGDGVTNTSITNGSAGSPALEITHSYATSGYKTVTLDISGTPDTISQTDSEVKTNYINIRSNPTPPDNLVSKPLTMASTSTGNSPRLAAQTVDNTNGNLKPAGSNITRYVGVSTVTTNTVTDANTAVSGTLVSRINGVDDGSAAFSNTGNAVGTYSSLEVIDDRDAHLAISASTYPTGFYKVFDARIGVALSSLNPGYNDLQLSHTVAGDTNPVGFVLDDLTAVPTLDISTLTMSEAQAGTKRYISGVPYYNTGGVVRISDLKIYNWIGQTYRDADPLSIQDGDNLESTTGAIISAQTKTYAEVEGPATYLDNGIPIAETGKTSANIYTFGDIDVNINGTTAAVARITAVANNVNGTGSAVELPTLINVYSSSITGVNEESIPVSSSLGATYTDAGRRIKLFGSSATDATPAYDSSVNYYTNQAWTGAVTVEGTNEAVVRWGVIKNVTTDFTDYLPVGPDLATGRTGYQYFTFAFRRTSVANFDITINGKISGLWIAAPGTDIDDTSTLNGWLDANANYAGSGVPGANTAAGGNGSNGCALQSSDRIPTGVAISGSYTMTLGGENLSNATGKQCFVRIQLAAGDYVNLINIGAAA